MDEFEITIKVLLRQKGTFRPFHEEIGTSKAPDGKEIQILSTVPHRNTIIAYDGVDYEVSIQDILSKVMNTIIHNDAEGESNG